ncbi:MAG: hypothetical protein CME70_08945 [Halobacteriovorax sp.]|nr:hypothetical protein [Halobacteriovorax sp.]|tara:strand:+ start:53885 stop:55288 length:1404 start_codon:yes stop_codon:yes gene_type:complete
MKKSSIGIKIGISIASLLITVMAVEIGLRTVGHLVQQAYEKEYIPEIDEANTQDNDVTYEHFNSGEESSVMCIGDSFTNGGNVQSYDSYPYFLFKHLDNDLRNLSVFNYGKCESTTFDALERIKLFLEKKQKKIKYISILVGSADMFGESFGPVNDRTILDKEIKIPSFIKDFRIYKMYRILKYEYYRRFGFTDRLRIPYSNITQKELIATHFIYENARNIYTINDDLIYNFNAPEAIKLRENLPKEYNPSWFNEVFPKETLPAKIYLERITMYLTSVYARKNKHSSITKLLLDLMNSHPLYFWQEDYLKALKYNLLQSLKLQSQYLPGDILQALLTLESRHPQLKTKGDFLEFKNVIKNWDKYTIEIDKKREETWDEMASLAEQNGITLILHTYPSNYSSANNMLRKMAKKHDLPLVDHNKTFSKLIAAEGREKYLFDDDHCTPLGYQIIAENVFKLIRELEIHGR